MWMRTACSMPRRPNPLRARRSTPRGSRFRCLAGSESAENVPLVGCVAYFDAVKGYGFLRGSDSGEKYFFHITNAPTAIAEGDRVTFELERGARGMNAVRVVIIND